MEEVVCPVLHENNEPPDAVSVAEAPEQILMLPLMFAVIPEVIVTVVTAEAVQIPVVTVTV